jgi:hypothetical protein
LGGDLEPADTSAMRFRTSLLLLLVAALALSAGAFAGERPGKPEKQNRPDKSAPCRKHVNLKGTFLAAGTDSFTMNVVKANGRRHRSLRGERTIKVDDTTRIKRKGKEGLAALSDLAANDRLHVFARCKPGEAAGSYELTARWIHARPPASPDSD